MNESKHLLGPGLDRSKWHAPHVSIVVTHHDYSHFLSDALLSILDQSHDNWDCIVVDDGSTKEHRDRAEWITNRTGDPRIQFHPLNGNIGKIPAFFRGLDRTTGDFVCLLDPDDRLSEKFLEETVRIHLNSTIACPIVATDQYTLTSGGVTTSVQSPFKLMKQQELNARNEIEEIDDFYVWVPPEYQGWIWTSTSALMFRRAALEYVRPIKRLEYKDHADAYLATGVHALGGSLCYTKPLVYRSLHPENSFISDRIFSTQQNKAKPGFVNRIRECRNDVFDALVTNGAPGITPRFLSKLAKSFDRSQRGTKDNRLRKMRKKYLRTWKRQKRHWRKRLSM